MRITMQSIEIKLLDRAYKIRCKDSEKENLQKAASFLNQNLKHHFNESPYVSFTDALTITALNTYSLLLQTPTHEIHDKSSASSKLNDAHQKIKKALAEE